MGPWSRKTSENMSRGKRGWLREHSRQSSKDNVQGQARQERTPEASVFFSRFPSPPTLPLDKERGVPTPWPEFIFHSGVLSPIAPLSVPKGRGVQCDAQGGSDEECILGQEAAGREGCLPTDTPLSSARPRPSRTHPDHGFPEPSIYVLSAAPRGLQGLMECERGLGFFILFSAVQIPHTFPFHSGSKFRTSKIAGLQGGGRDFTSRERQGPSQRLPP